MFFNKDRAYQVMNENNIDALVVSDPQNITYVSNFPHLLKCTYERRICVIIPLKDKPSIILRTSFIAMHNTVNSWIKDIRVYGNSGIIKSPDLIEKNLSPKEKLIIKVLMVEGREFLDVVIDTLKEKGLSEANIVFDKSSFDIIGRHITDVFPNSNIKLDPRIIQNIRLVKSKNEIEVLKRAAQINEKGIKEILKTVDIGKTEKELDEVYKSTVIKEGAEPHFSNILGGSRGALVNDFPSNYKLKDGDPIRIDVDCIFKHYYSDIARSAILGKSNKKFEQIYNILLYGLEKAEQIIKPGVSPKEIYDLAISTVKRAGLENYNRYMIGHAIGMDCYDRFIISPTEKKILEKGMVFNIELMYYELGTGCPHIEDTVLVTKDGFKSLQSMDMGLYRI